MVKEKIIEKLQNGITNKQLLIDNIVTECGVTIQSVYKELRRLRSDDIVIDKDTKLSLTLWYINQQFEKWKHTDSLYNKTIDASHIFKLKKGNKSLSFIFNNLTELDAFWTQTYLLLERIIPERIPTYACIPHDWFFYSRPLSDERWTNAQSRIQRLIITHPTKLDFLVLKHRRKQRYQFTPNKNPLKQSELKYYTLIGDWIFEIELDKKIGNVLNDFILNTTEIENISTVELNNIMAKKGKFKLKVSNNPMKAKILTKKFAKYFD